MSKKRKEVQAGKEMFEGKRCCANCKDVGCRILVAQQGTPTTEVSCTDWQPQ